MQGFLSLLRAPKTWLPATLEVRAPWPLTVYQPQGRRSRGLEPGLEQLRGGGVCPVVVWAWPSPSPPPPPTASPHFCCTPPTPVDMIFLVDGSWSIGHSHFQQVKDFLASVIEPFEIGPNKVQVGGYQPPALPPGIPTSPTSTQGRHNSEKREVWEEAQSLWGNRRTALPIGVTCCQQADPLPGRAGGGPPQGLGKCSGDCPCANVCPPWGPGEAVCGTDGSAPST